MSKEASFNIENDQNSDFLQVLFNLFIPTVNLILKIPLQNIFYN